MIKPILLNPTEEHLKHLTKRKRMLSLKVNRMDKII